MYGRDTAGEKPPPDRFVRLFHLFFETRVEHHLTLALNRAPAHPSPSASGHKA
jgi:hypothetical protein